MKNRIASILVAASLAALAGCGGAQTDKVDVSAGPMPPGGSFDGVFQSAAYGRMEFTCQGNSCVGLYEGERHFGRIEGTINGNVMSFSWTQWNEDLQGKHREATGKGFFRYVIQQEKGTTTTRDSHHLKGEWGYDDSNAGNKWEAVKLSDRAKKTLKPREVDGTTTVMDDDYASSAGFGVSEGAQESDTSVEMKSKKEKEEEKADDSLDGLF